MRRITKTTRGVTLVEVLVAAAIILVALDAMVGTFNLYLRVAYGNSTSAEAAYLAEEGIEAVKILRDNSWATNIAPLTNNSSYHLIFQGGTWKSTTVDSYIDGTFERTFQLGAVSRDASSNITSSGTLDLGTRLVTVNVSWGDRGATTTKSLATYITNFNND